MNPNADSGSMNEFQNAAQAAGQNVDAWRGLAAGWHVRMTSAEAERDSTQSKLSECERERDEAIKALEEIDTYLANDPDVWRIVSVAKVGDVLCQVLGADVIQRINASVEENLCARCQTEVRES